jgi:N-acetyl-1-D-myo-inositol-2-amino-2-deoxy-alpha-D-glucopyranoside deacetylase
MSKGGILCAFAHPDDEQFGTAGALLACTDRGIPVHILCATRGEAGEISPGSLATRETLGAVREQELRAACELLGIQPPEFLGYMDGDLGDADRAELRDRIVEAIRRLRPRVVITFDANGGYGHPDHIAIHFATVDAVLAAADPAHRPDLGGPHAVDKLYATAYPRSDLGLFSDGLASIGVPTIDFGEVQTIPVEEIGTSDDRITTVVPVQHLFERRSASLFAHRTQYGPESFFARFPEELNRKMMAFDYFVRLQPAPPDGARLPDESDLWDGMPLTGEKSEG